MKKFMCVLLSLVLILPFAIMCVSAVEPKFETYEIGAVEALRFPEDRPPDAKPAKTFDGGSFAKRGLTSAADEPYLFYTQLTNDMQRLIYNSLAETHGGLDNAGNNDTAISINISQNTSDWYFTNQAGLNTLAQNAFDAIVPALTAFAEDFPQYFWISISYNGASFSYENAGSRYRGILILNFNSSNTDAYSTWGVIRDYYDRMLVSVANYNIEGNTRYEKLKSIHDQIVNTITYDPNYNNSNKNLTNHEPVAVFNSPYLAVCEGYAEAFKLLCDREGIPCITISGDAGGGGHKWNYVKMEDANWYAVDVTWDDPMGNVDTLYFDHFISGSATKAPFFGGEVFSEEHTPDGTIFVSNEFALAYPTLSEKSYSLAVPNIGSTATFDRAANRIHFEKSATLSNEFFATVNYSYPSQISGQTVTISGGSTTGAKATVKNGNTTVVYTVIRWGDLTADGNSNSSDYTRAKNVLQGTYNLSSTSANYAAGDFNEDGVIDAFDMYYLNKYINS